MLPVSIVAIGFASAVLLRQWPAVRERLSVAASTILAVAGAVVLGFLVLEASGSGRQRWLTLVAAAAAASALVLAGAWGNEHVLGRLRRRRAAAGPGPTDRLVAWAGGRPAGLSGGLFAVLVRSWRRAVDVRVTGLAAEMSYYGLISLVPLLIALGSSLGFLGRIVGTEEVARIEEALVEAVAQVFAADVTEDVVAPLVSGLLREERAGFAIGSVLVALWLASRMFRAAIRALDDAYQVPERRSFVGQYVLGLVLALGAVITVVVLLTMIVIGPLLGDGQEIADRFGLGSFFEFAWSVMRWPAVAAVIGAYLTLLYRYGPNVATTWRRCVPGAVLGTIGLMVVAIGFSLYIGVVGLDTQTMEAADAAAGTAAVVGAAQAIGVVLAGVVWLWLSGIVLLLGGVLNAELDTSPHHAADGGPTYQPVAP